MWTVRTASKEVFRHGFKVWFGIKKLKVQKCVCVCVSGKVTLLSERTHLLTRPFQTNVSMFLVGAAAASELLQRMLGNFHV